MTDYRPEGVPENQVKIHCVILNVVPQLVDGKYEAGYELTFPHGNGDYLDDCRTDHYFYLVDVNGDPPADWVFDEIELDGKTYSGFYITPDRGYSATFANAERTAIRVTNDVAPDFWRHEFKLLVRNTKTDDRVIQGPGGGNGSGPGGP